MPENLQYPHLYLYIVHGFLWMLNHVSFQGQIFTFSILLFLFLLVCFYLIYDAATGQCKKPFATLCQSVNTLRKYIKLQGQLY